MTRARPTFLVPLLAVGLLFSAHGAGAQIVVTGPATPATRSLTAWFAHHIPSTVCRARAV